MTARAMTWFLKEVGSQANAHCIGYVPPPLSPFRFLVTQKTNFGLFFTLHRTLITQPQAGRTELLRDCLQALPNLHTLVIIDDGFTRHTEIQTVFMELEFPNIKRAAIPIHAGPILSWLPNLEELTCYCEYVRRSSFGYIPRSSW